MRQLRYVFGLSSTHYPDPSHRILDREFDVDNWVLSDFITRQLVPIVGNRPFPVSEQLLMTGALCWFKPTHIFEWGTHVGKSARLFYETAKAFSITTEIHSIDLPENVEHIEHPHDQRGMMVRGLSNVHLHLGDGLETAGNIINSLPSNNTSILFFIDGDHSYASVKRELDHILKNWPKTAVLLHDTFFQLPSAGYNVGPHQAIQDVLGMFPNQYHTVSVATGLPGMTLVYPKYS